MLVVFVSVEVKPGMEDAFIEASLANALSSILEPGVARFDVVRSMDNPSSFVLAEAYRSEGAPAAHKETAHYKAWREAVEPMMAKPRTFVKYSSVFLPEGNWGTA